MKIESKTTITLNEEEKEILNQAEKILSKIRANVCSITAEFDDGKEHYSEEDFYGTSCLFGALINANLLYEEL